MKKHLITVSLLLLTAVADSNEGLQLTKSEGDLFYYDGKITVSGTYSWQLNEFERGALCFFVKGPTEKLIPRIADSRSPWFCFSNDLEAKGAFKVPESLPEGVCYFSGEATVKISRYVVNRTQSAVHDTANLDQITSRTNPVLKKCETRP